jgi:glycine oxidase
MPDVVVIGGGAIGCATAFFLSREGANVTLLERADLAGEASGAAAGMLAALSDEGGFRGEAFQRLCIDGLNLYGEVLPELEATGHDLRYRRTGVLHLAMNPSEVEEMRHRFEAQKRLSPKIRWLEAHEIADEEPEASLDALAGFISPEEHYLDPQRLVLALAEAARRHGAGILTEQEVVRFRRDGDRVVAVETKDAAYEVDAVVLAMGPWTAMIARRLGAYVPVRPMRGQMVALAGPGTPLRRIVWGARAYLVPRERGMTFVGATVEDVGFRKRITSSAIRSLKRAAVEMIPGLALARELSAWAGLRPASEDGLPILGLLPEWRNAWVATGHFRNGILLAPISGKLIASSVLAGSPDPEIEPFSPTRFERVGRAILKAGPGRGVEVAPFSHGS